MDRYNKVIDGIVADLAYEDGYRLGEKELSLDDEKPKYPPQLQDSLIMGEKSKSKGMRFRFDADDADMMNKEAIELGVIKQPMAFPYLTKKEPCNIWDKLYTYDPTSRAGHIKHTELVYLDDEGQPVFTVLEPAPPPQRLKRAVSTAVSRWLDMTQEKGLKDHLTAGYCAYVTANGSEAYWATVPHYFLSLLWGKELATYRNKVHEWEFLERTIDKAKKFNLALVQQANLAPLPFPWTVAKCSKETAQVNQMQSETYHATHLVLTNSFTGYGYHLMKGDFLCLVNDEQPIDSNPDNILEYDCKVEGVTLKTVPHTITCQQCLTHIEVIFKELTHE